MYTQTDATIIEPAAVLPLKNMWYILPYLLLFQVSDMCLSIADYLGGAKKVMITVPWMKSTPSVQKVRMSVQLLAKVVNIIMKARCLHYQECCSFLAFVAQL